MFTYWGAPIYRPTADIDLLGRVDSEVETFVSIVREVCEQEVMPDGMVFHPNSATGERIIEGAVYQGVRISVRGTLGNARITITTQIDVGFGDAVIPSSEQIVYPTILDFPAPTLVGYSPESTIAEKFATMMRLGLLNSRMKDYFDIWLLSRRFPFDGKVLAPAIKECCLRRGISLDADPVALSSDFAEDPNKKLQWKAFVRKGRLVGVNEDLGVIISAAGAFLGPILRALAEGRAFEGTWQIAGPWRTE